MVDATMLHRACRSMALAAAALSARIDACGAMACRLPPSDDDDIDTYIAASCLSRPVVE